MLSLQEPAPYSQHIEEIVSVPLRVLVVSRLFTGLADSLTKESWRPSGVPAIYKLINALAQEADIESMFVFACKDECSAERYADSRTVMLDGLGSVRILGWRRRMWLERFGLGGKLRELSHFLQCLVLYVRFRPHITYFTNANIVTAGVFTRLGLGPVVLRLLGLHPVEKAIANSANGLMRWFYQSPFAHVICTLDGSGGSYILPRLFRRGVPVSIELNGVDWKTPSKNDVAEFRARFGLGGRPVVMFIGRLEQTKGCVEFVDGMVRLLRSSSVDAVIVGHGILELELRERITKAGLTDAIHLTGQLPHAEIPTALAAADIYVSLNQLGNLSNTNLEAISQGKCMLILDNCLETHVDEETAGLLPEEVFPRISRLNTAEDLAGQIGELLREPTKIDRMATQSAAVGKRILFNWAERIDREIGLIRTSANWNTERLL